MKKKILVVTYDSHEFIAGPNTWLKNLILFLSKQNFEIFCCVEVDNLLGENLNLPFVNFLKEHNYQYVALNRYDNLTKFRTLSADYFIQSILKETATFLPDLAICNLCYPPNLAMKWLRQAGVPSVAIMHSDDDYWHSVANNFAIGKPDYSHSAFVCGSEFLYQTLTEKSNTKTPTTYIKKIAYGVPKSNFFANFDGKLRIVFVGRFDDHQKRVSDTAQALCNIAKKYPDVEATMYGNGSALNSVLSILEKSNAPTVRYGGILKHEEYYATVSLYNIFILLSDYEGLPVALLEAMACGLVPIVTNISSGINQVVRHQENGFIVNDRNEDLMKTIDWIKNNYEQLAVMSQKNIDFINSTYSTEATFKEWKQLIETLLEKQSKDEKKLKRLKNVSLSEIRQEIKNLNSEWIDMKLPTQKDRIMKYYIAKLRIKLAIKTRLKKLLRIN